MLFLLLPCFSAQHTLLLTRYANLVYLGFRRSLAYLHLSAASPPSRVTIGGNCVCVLSSLVCNLYRLLVASLTAGLNIVPIMENSLWCLVKAREGTSPVTIVTSVPWERERDITEVAVLAAWPAKRRSVSVSDVIVACTAFYTASQLVSICIYTGVLSMVMGVCSLLCLLKSTTSSLVLSMLSERWFSWHHLVRVLTSTL